LDRVHRLNRLNRITIVVALAVLGLCTALAQVGVSTMTFETATGKLQNPPNFFTANAEAIQAAICNGGGDTCNCPPPSNERVFNLVVPFGLGVTDFELKALSPGGTLVYYYHSPDPAKAQVTSQVWTKKPAVYFCSVASTDPKAWQTQGATGIGTQTAGAGASGFVVVVDETIPGETRWVYALMSAGGFLKQGTTPVWFPVTPKQ